MGPTILPHSVVSASVGPRVQLFPLTAFIPAAPSAWDTLSHVLLHSWLASVHLLSFHLTSSLLKSSRFPREGIQ